MEILAPPQEKQEFRPDEDHVIVKTLKNLKIPEVMAGKASHRRQTAYVLLVSAAFVAICAIAQSLYPTDYSFLTEHISHQGGWANNPDGYWIWDIGIFITGFLFIPNVLFVYRKLHKFSPDITNIAKHVGIVASVGMSFVGVFPEDLVLWHQIPSVIAFIGYVMWAYLNWIPLFKLMKELQSPWTKKLSFHFLYTILNVVFITAMVVPNVEINNSWNLAYWLFTFPFWEWMLLGAVFLCMIGILGFLKHK